MPSSAANTKGRGYEGSAARKIHGTHSTIIGGREGKRLLLKVAGSPLVKKIIPGVIENKGTASPSGGLRLKLTRSDARGNVRALLVEGSTVQEIRIVTSASSREEGEKVLYALKRMLND